MKIVHFYICVIFICVTSIFNVNAQQSDNQVKLKLTDPKTQKSQTYLLNSAYYSFSRPYTDSVYKDRDPSEAYKISIDFRQSPDELLLKWMGGEVKEIDGTITVEARDSGKLLRSISFKRAIVDAASESFSTGDSYSYLSAQISIHVNTLVVDDIVIYESKDVNK